MSVFLFPLCYRSSYQSSCCSSNAETVSADDRQSSNAETEIDNSRFINQGQNMKRVAMNFTQSVL